MNNYMPNIIKNALEEIGRDDLFDLIENTRTPYCDALVWFNLKTLRIEVDAVPHGDYPCPCGPRILLHREETCHHIWDINWDKYVKECINNALMEIKEQEDEDNME